MDWIDDAIILHARPYGETSTVLDVLSREHGRHAGLVRGGRSRKLRPVLQAGNVVNIEWRARLPEHLGFFTLELVQPYAARALDDRLALSGIGTLVSLAAMLADRDPHPALFDLAVLVLDHMDNASIWPGLLVRWELRLLAELGAGLDLEQCVVTGTREDLIYVSPKSGSAVSAAAGAPYKDKLLRLPDFLRSAGDVSHSPGDVADGFAITGHFLERHLLDQRNRPLPIARQDFLQLLHKMEQ